MCQTVNVANGYIVLNKSCATAKKIMSKNKQQKKQLNVSRISCRSIIIFRARPGVYEYSSPGGASKRCILGHRYFSLISHDFGNFCIFFFFDIFQFFFQNKVIKIIFFFNSEIRLRINQLKSESEF